MKILIFCAALVLGSQAVSIFDLVREQWDSFKITYRKQYQSETEERFRMKIFMENSLKIAKHNKLYGQGLVSYNLGINKYADLLHHEFIQLFTGFNMSKNLLAEEKEAITFLSPANIRLPNEVDWRLKGAVTGVKNQEACGSCWAFSTTGSLEGQHFRKTGQLISLSEQNLVDCSWGFENYGCSGGWMDNAFRYIIQNKGIDTEASYPYKGVNQQCSFNSKAVGATVNGYVDIESGSEDKLKAAVATVGPVSVAIDASSDSFQFYSEGIYTNPECSTIVLDHAVLAVGYGSENGKDYWIVKNSWGTSWGESGYIKMARNENNMCGIATKASYPVV